MNKLLQFFFRGLLVILPLSITIYVLVVTVNWIDGLLQTEIPGLGFLILIAGTTLIGIMTSFLVTGKVFEFLEKLLKRLPFVNILYTSIKDLVSAFVGDKKKFNEPVLVLLNKADEVYKMGFITEQDLERLDLPGYVSVYLPHSYNISGNHYIVPIGNVRKLGISGTEAMKYVISGGVSRGE